MYDLIAVLSTLASGKKPLCAFDVDGFDPNVDFVSYLDGIVFDGEGTVAHWFSHNEDEYDEDVRGLRVLTKADLVIDYENKNALIEADRIDSPEWLPDGKAVLCHIFHESGEYLDTSYVFARVEGGYFCATGFQVPWTTHAVPVKESELTIDGSQSKYEQFIGE